MINLPGIVAYYPLDGDAKDYSGNGYDGIVYGNPTFNNGMVNQSIYFPSENDYFKVDNFGNNFNSNVITFSFWVYFSDIDNYNGRIIQIRDLTDDTDGIWVGKSGIGSGGGASTKVGASFTTPLENNKWYHILAISDGANGTKLYLNGQLNNQDSNEMYNIISGKPMYVNNDGAYSKSPIYLDQIYIFNRALSGDEVLQLYNEPFTKKQNLFCAFETTPDIDITMYDPNIKPKFVSDIIYTDYDKEEITDNSYTINNPNYKYADVYILINSGDISKNGEIVDSNCEGIYFYQKCVNNDKFEIKGDLNKIIVVYHNGYWSDLGDSSNG